MDNTRAVILAAGAQKRFGGEKPKCLYRVNGCSVLEHLVKKLNMPTTIVLHDGWRSKDIDEVAALGLPMAYVRQHAHIGLSIATGLRKVGAGRTIVIAADTYIPPDELLLIPDIGTALFDPWQWITIYHILATHSSADHFEAKCYDRVEYLAAATLVVDIVKTNYVNVNDTLGLVAARIREREAGGSARLYNSRELCRKMLKR